MERKAGTKPNRNSFDRLLLLLSAGRLKSSTDAGGNLTTHTYEKDGALKTVVLNGDTYVQDIRHNAKGQREAIWYGNGTKTSYTYDALSYRLRRLLTVNVDSASSHYNEVLQDGNYFYDAVGNITTIRDDSQQALFYNNTVVSPAQDYVYDSLYRLVRAEGREQVGLATFGTTDNWNDSGWTGIAHKGDGGAVQRYIQKYSYDKAGNMLELKHVAPSGSYTRTFSVGTANNRLQNNTVGTNTYSYSHDARGNMSAMPHLSAMDYDHLSQLHHLTAGTTGAHYQYSGGGRIRKYLSKSGGITEERIYLGSYEVYRKRDSSGVITLERTTVHVSDDSGRIAMLEVLTVGSDALSATVKRFIYSNHLQSAGLELDERAKVISYEEYHSFGTTSYQAMNGDIKAVAKRYRFTGKERDEESGLNYHGARYYAPWLCRWCAVDPMQGQRSVLSPYNYCQNNPVNRVDMDGMLDGDGKEEKKQPPPSYINRGIPDNMRQRNDMPPSPTYIQPLINPKPAPHLDFTPPPTLPTSKSLAERGVKKAAVSTTTVKSQKPVVSITEQIYGPIPDDILMPDINGMGHSGPRPQVQAEVSRIAWQRAYQTADNITNGVFGSYGYIMNRDAGSDRGALADGVVMSVVPNPGLPFGKTESVHPDALTVDGFQTEQVPEKPNELSSISTEKIIEMHPDLIGVPLDPLNRAIERIANLRRGNNQLVSRIDAFGSRAGSTFRGRGPLPTSDLDIMIRIDRTYMNDPWVIRTLESIQANFGQATGFPMNIKSDVVKKQIGNIQTINLYKK